ncbi:MAG: DEAD/DEAH box helicase [Acidobacteria bacterium]|nr:DEAD/DEAH box helicase [Acidobacteriota bacterium]
MPRRTFKTGASKPIAAPDAEALFHDLKRRSSSIQHLWAHQADLIRLYHSDHQESAHVALELPTGAGKTLVGLLIGEYRRRLGERVLYLCPTRQLVHQVSEQASDYGIPARVVLPKTYQDINDYHLGAVVAVTTYSALFNTNPRFTDPQLILLDDAHAGEDYIAGLWSPRISRVEHDDIYKAILNLFKKHLDPWFRRSLFTTSPSPEVRFKVELLPLPHILSTLPALIDLLEEKLTDKAKFPWSMVREALRACNIFVSWGEILIRPLSPPTMRHAPFAEAKQRVYMSATLGAGGELERITGVRKIQRIPVPKQWERHSAGRRLFILPNRSMDPTSIDALQARVVTQATRATVLTPTLFVANKVERNLKKAKIHVMTASDIEESLDSFAKSRNTALVLTNRYDGLDLPDEACRLLVVDDLPGGVNLQEHFFLTRLRASSLLRDRLRTRFTQAVGRCSRGPNDYAAVLLAGSRLFEFCAKPDNRIGMHPELQAELEFGIQNSEDLSIPVVVDLLDQFYQQGPDWEVADDDIKIRRETKHRVADPVAGQLAAVVAAEIDYVYSLWIQDYDTALERAIAVSDGLSGDSLKGYRGFWYYNAGTAAWLAAQQPQRPDMRARARELFKRAAKASKSVPWFAELGTLSSTAPPPNDVEHGRVAEAVYSRLEEMGFVGPHFEQQMSAFEAALASTAAETFEPALSLLGRLLGWEAYKPLGDGRPDSVWLLGDQLAIAFEAKSGEKPEGGISIKTVRQALTHAATVKSEGVLASNGDVLVAVASPRVRIDPTAASLANDLRYVSLEGLQEIGANVRATLRRLRANLGTTTDAERAVTVICEAYVENELMPTNVRGAVTAARLKTLPKVSG